MIKCCQNALSKKVVADQFQYVCIELNGIDTRAANLNSNLSSNSKALDLFVELELELKTQNFVVLELELENI